MNAGFNPEKVLVMQLSPNWSKYTVQSSRETTNANYAAYFRQVLDKVKQQPGLQAAALSSTYPLNAAGITSGPNNVSVQVEGRPLAEGQLAPQLDPSAVSPDYFRTISTPLIKGRMFTDADDEKAPPVA